MRLPRLSLLPPWYGLTLAAICGLYLLAGLFGHDPWKNDDAIHFGIAWSLLQGHDGLVPQLGGSPWLETPPLYYWLAATLGRLLGDAGLGLLPLHAAIRLASGLCGALMLGLLVFAGRTLHEVSKQDPANAETGRLAGNAAALIAIGCLGLLIPIHDTQPLIGLLAGSAATYAGLALILNRPFTGGALAGFGLGFGFLTSGMPALLNLAPLIILLPLNRHWRSPSALRGLLTAALIGTLLCATWPMLLWTQHPDQLNLWWEHALASMHYQSEWWRALPHFAELLSWFAWPALPLAFWALWLKRRHLAQPLIALPLTGTLLSFIALLFYGEPRPLPALALLVPLTLQAASSAHMLRRGAANAFDWFGMMTFSILAGLVWLGSIAMTAGVPVKIANNIARLVPGFVTQFSWPAYVLASLLTLAWLWLIFAGSRSPWRGVSHWAGGVTLMWVLLTTLWLPWIDYGKSYRAVAESLHQAIPANVTCIAGRDLGSAQKVSLEYFSGIRTIAAGTPAGHACPLLLEQGSEQAEKTPRHWRKIWEGHRPGDRSERLRLFLRD